ASSRSKPASISTGTGPLGGAPPSNPSTPRTGRQRRPPWRRVRRSQPRAMPRAGDRRQADGTSLVPAPTNRPAPTARPSRPPPGSPTSVSGASQALPRGPAASQSPLPPDSSTCTGDSVPQAQARKPASTPHVAATAGGRVRHTAQNSAGASVASAENETAPTSASDWLPAITRL